jgi:competence ComEA-like helix-hairpin-helix protein
MCTASGADVAFVGYGGIRGSLAAGPVTLRDLYLVYPFDDPLRVLELTGAELIKAFRGSLDSGRLDLGASGLSFTYDLTRPLNSRISDLEVRGKPLKANGRTTLVVTEFLLQRLLVERRVRPESIRELDTTVYQALLQHCQARPDVSAAGGSLLSAAFVERGERSERILGTVPEPTIVQALVASPPRLWQTHKIPLNTASEELLASLPWIGPELASAIISERDRRGGFRSLEDLKEIEGLSDDLYKKLERILTLP